MARPDLKYPIPAFQLPAPGNRAPLTKQKPPPKRPVALPQKGFNRPSRLSSNLPALHPHQIKETPRYHKIKNIGILKRFHHIQHSLVISWFCKEFIMAGLQCLIVDMMKSCCSRLRNHHIVKPPIQTRNDKRKISFV